MPPKSVGIIGYGQFGQFVTTLVQRFFSDVELRICGGRNATAEEWRHTATADVVVVCVPIAHYQQTLNRLADSIAEHTIVLDVATVKGITTEWFQTNQQFSGRYICTHPMFGPASYQKTGGDITGFRIVVTDHNLPPEQYQAICTLLDTLGFRIITMDADAHDRYLAETLFLTHFLAQTVTAANFVRTDIDTVSFGFLMDAVESVRDDVALFRDVYQHNPHCDTVLRRLREAGTQVEQTLYKDTATEM